MAQYLGGKIQYETVLGDKPTLETGHLYGISLDFDIIAYGFDNSILDIDINEFNLLLRSIDQLTDDECIMLASIVVGEPFNRYRRMEVTRNYNFTGFPYIMVHHKSSTYSFQIDCTLINFNLIDMGEDISCQTNMKPYACIDYLRSIGILLPFTYLDENGKPITLQPDEIVSMGWAKIDK